MQPGEVRYLFQGKTGRRGFLRGLKFPNISDIIAICTKLILRRLLVKLPITMMRKEKKHFCDVIVSSEYRNRGFGTAGIELICKAAKENGISVLYDDIAIDNPSYKLFLKNGFEIDYQNDDVVMVKREL